MTLDCIDSRDNPVTTARLSPCPTIERYEAPARTQLLEYCAVRVYATSPALSRLIEELRETKGCYAKIFLAGVAILAIGLLISMVGAIIPPHQSSRSIVAIFCIGFDLIKNGATENQLCTDGSRGRHVIFNPESSIASSTFEESTISAIPVDWEAGNDSEPDIDKDVPDRLRNAPMENSQRVGRSDLDVEKEYIRSCSEILPDPENDEGP